jgi:hypothetical protein
MGRQLPPAAGKCCSCWNCAGLSPQPPTHKGCCSPPEDARRNRSRRMPRTEGCASTITKCSVLFGLLNAVVMLLVASIKINEQWKMAASIGVSLSEVEAALEKAEVSSPGGTWLWQLSAAFIILFALFNLPFEGAGVLAAFGANCCRENWFERVSPPWAKCLVCVIEATILVLLQVYHHWSVTGWAFSTMCGLNGLLHMLATCIRSPDSTRSDSNTENMTPGAREMRVMDRDGSVTATAAAGAGTRPALEESESTVAPLKVFKISASGTHGTRPPQIADAIRNGII